MAEDNFNGFANKGRPVYLDNQATTPLDPRVMDAMMPFFTDKFGNPHSQSHFYGWEAEEAVETARAKIAALIGASAKEIIFTSGATESNNLAIKGAARLHQSDAPGSERNTIVTCATEHKCVLESCAALESEGITTTYLPVSENGLIDMDRLRDAITDKTILVTIMAVNNEIGVIQPLAEIGALCREKNVFFHTDAAQAAGKIPLDVEDMAIDLMSITGHKFCGPMGIGVLYVRRRPRVRLDPLISGGGQEQGIRPGTLPAPLCVGLGETADIAKREMNDEAARLTKLRDRFLEKLLPRVEDIVVNGDMKQRIPGNLNLSFPGIRSDTLMAGLKDLALSSGSACSSEAVEPSYVLKALGLSDDLAVASIRVGLGRFTTEHDIDFAAEAIAAEVERQRANLGQRAPAA
ncbi:MAG: IscS subfamily cysteine desulfurase [Rhodospirillales bacterium]|nr:IscS subfamily cysteine desulfurase [Alphaproteobacteria bacterium]MBL6948592.1 IscS subfamily cysteine desulfurase [Rhodospirillales bacterium]